MRILVIEDEAALRTQLTDRLVREGFRVDASGDGDEGLYLATEYPFDAAVVDLGLPGMPGIEIIRRLRAAGNRLPVLVLTARGRWQDKVEGLEAGADDYLAKPFEMEELLARLRALLRRAAGAATAELIAGPVRLDRAGQRVTVDGRPVDLTDFEFRLLERLMTERGRVLSKRELADYLSVAEDLTEYRRELAGFRGSLTGWLGAMSIILLVALLLALRWGLAPLRRVANEVAACEAGAQDRLHGVYPRELRALTDNLNALLAHASARQSRLGNALADLAHSLKTPLAVLRGALGEASLQPALAARLAEQIHRMDAIVAYQLERARARPLIALAVERLIATLTKLHAGRAVAVTLDLEPGLVFRGIEGDLLEVLGNLLDNAYKWCRTQVEVGGWREGGMLVLWVRDDGPGIPPDQVRAVIERGARADVSTPGHGIGLAVVHEICRAYGGDLVLTDSPVGGTLARVRLAA